MPSTRLAIATARSLPLAVAVALASPTISAVPGPIANSVTDSVPGTAPRAVAPRGLTGELFIDLAGPPLRAAQSQGPRSSVVVRVTEMTDREQPSGDATPPMNSLRRYRIEFIGGVAGTFDLREFLERRDGTPIADLPPLPVKIVSELPAAHGTDLFQSAREPFRLTSRYLLAMGLLAAAWIAVPIVVLIRRAWRRPPVVVPVVAPAAPTLADQLRPLIDAARAEGLSVAERGRLELLLMNFWRERLALDGLSPADAAAQLRSDPRSSPLLLALERWLHARGAGSPRPEEDVAALLEPYRAAPAQPQEPRA